MPAKRQKEMARLQHALMLFIAVLGLTASPAHSLHDRDLQSVMPNASRSNTGGCDNTLYFLTDNRPCEYLRCDLEGGTMYGDGSLVCSYSCEWKRFALAPGC